MHRGSSKLKEKQQETKLLQEQTKRMEEKLALLRQQVQQQKKMKADPASTLQAAKQRWGSNDVPLKSYAKQVLNQQKKAFVQLGIDEKKIFGKKSFDPILKKKEEEKRIVDAENKVNEDMARERMQRKPNIIKGKIAPVKVQVQTLQDFLTVHYLMEYITPLTRYGINSLEQLARMTRGEMTAVGIKVGHQTKILNKLNGQPYEKGDKVQTGYGDNNVKEYMNQNQKSQSERGQQNNVTHQDKEQIQDNEFVVFLTVAKAQIMLQTQQQQLDNCYQCYKQTAAYSRIQNKVFCSEVCLESYKQQMQRQCPECGRKFLKSEGVSGEGKWYCSIGCSPARQDIEQLMLKWHNN